MSVELSEELVLLGFDLGDEGSKWLCGTHRLLPPHEYIWCTCALTCNLGKGN